MNSVTNFHNLPRRDYHSNTEQTPEKRSLTGDKISSKNLRQ